VVLEISNDTTEQKRMEAERDATKAALQESHEQLQAFSRRLVEMQERERTALARELHDQAGQSLIVLKLGLGQLLAVTPERLPADVQALKVLVDEVMDSLHRVVVSLRPAALDRLGLAPALRQQLASLSKQTGLAVTFAAGGLDEERLPETLETAGYRIVQEALTNIVRHAGARQVSVSLEQEAGRLILSVQDDGAGFDVAAAQRSGRMGLLGMRERAELLGGTMTLDSRPGAGSHLRVELPLGGGDEQG
jgi:signal transduction histidine kinase